MEVKNLDLYGHPPIPWERARGQFQQRAFQGGRGTYWLSTTCPDGRPHVAGVLGVWIGDTLYFASGAGSRKSRNLATNPACALAASLPDLDVVIEGTARRVSDTETLESLAAEFARRGWPVTVSGDALTASLCGAHPARRLPGTCTRSPRPPHSGWRPRAPPVLLGGASPEGVPWSRAHPGSDRRLRHRRQEALGMRGGRRRALHLEEEVIRIAEVPVLSGLVRAHHRVAVGAVVGGGVPARRGIAAADVPTELADPEVDPVVPARREAFDASGSRGRA